MLRQTEKIIEDIYACQDRMKSCDLEDFENLENEYEALQEEYNESLWA